MKKYLLILFALIGLTAFSQEEEFDVTDSGFGCISGDCDNGLGKYVWKNGDYYGAWKDGKMEGKGTYYKSDGSIYEGFWSKNKKMVKEN